MERELLFRGKVELREAVGLISGLHIDLESWAIDWIVLERGLPLAKVAKRVEVNRMRPTHRVYRIDRPWVDLERFSWHQRHGTVLRAATRVHFMDRSGLTRVWGDLLGVVADDQWRCTQLIAAVEGRRVWVPVEAAWLQNDDWIYVDADRCPIADLEEYRDQYAEAAV